MKTKNILLVEDDYVDVTSVKRALAKLNVKHRLHVVHNGVDALAILNGDSTGSRLLPDIILLDLNMPKMNGLEFLGIIKNYYSLKNIKIFVMTTSAEEYDFVATQQLGVHGYILKPLDFERIKKDRYSEAVSSLKEELLSDHSKMFLPVLFPAAGSAWAGWKAKMALFKKGATALHYFGTAKIATLSVVALSAVVVLSPTLVEEPVSEIQNKEGAIESRPATLPDHAVQATPIPVNAKKPVPL